MRKPTHERVGRLLAGFSVLAVTLMAWFHDPLWLLAAAVIGLNLAVSAITDRCAIKSLLIHLGLPGERDLGRSEVRRGSVSKRHA